MTPSSSIHFLPRVRLR